jgi:glycosyltransferase involved in cell wall biosynthesis
MTTVSVVIPTYNYEHYINRSIDSVLDQTVLPVEIIIVDDGSTDDTEQIIERKYNADDKIKYIKKTNAGPASARNMGIEHAAGEFVLLLDADDTLQPNAIELLTEKIETFPLADMVLGGSFSVHPSKEKRYCPAPLLKENKFDNFKAFLNKKIPICHGKFMVRKSMFDRIKYPEHLRSSEDLSVYAQLIATCDIVTVDAPIVQIFHHSDSLRHNHEFVEKAGLSIIDAVFDPKLLPPEFFKCKSDFYIRRCHSNFRTLYKAGKYKEAERYFNMAVGQSPLALFNWKYLSKYLRMKFRWRSKTPS